MTENEMLALLRQRYTEKAGNGDAWAFIPHVRNAAGFDASRTADAIAMALWPSRGLTLHGFEIKVSRGDWQRELKSPDKAEAFCRIVDRWWLVVANDKIVLPGELPESWGLLVANGKRLVCKREAPPLRDQTKPLDITRSFLAALLRSACRVAEAGPAEIAEAVATERVRVEAMYELRLSLAEGRYEDLMKKVRRFEQEAGVLLGGWSDGRNVMETGQALRLVLQGEHEVAAAENRLRAIGRTAQSLIEQVERQVGSIETRVLP